MSRKILVFSIALNGYDLIFSKCLKSHRQYCQRYGYEYVLVNRTPNKNITVNECSWLKIPLLLKALENGYEWVLFIDADCEIRPNTPPITKVRVEGKEIYMAHGFSGRINAGVIIAHNSFESFSFFQQVFKNAETKVPYEDRAPYENGHVIYYGKNNPQVYILERCWNNNSEIAPNDYIQHYSGGELRKIYQPNLAGKLMKIWLNHSILKKIRKTTRNFSQSKPKSLISTLKNHVIFYQKYYKSFS